MGLFLNVTEPYPMRYNIVLVLCCSSTKLITDHSDHCKRYSIQAAYLGCDLSSLHIDVIKIPVMLFHGLNIFSFFIKAICYKIQLLLPIPHASTMSVNHVKAKR